MHKQLLHMHYVKSLVYAAEQHLRITGEYSHKHLSDTRAEIDNRTCAQAFIQTFTATMQQHATTLKNKHKHHDSIVKALIGFTTEVIETVQHQIDMMTMIQSANEIIASYTEE